MELRGGPTVFVRPITSADEPAMTAYLEGLSKTARYMRFMQATPRISRRMVEWFTGGDTTRRLVLVAVLDGEIVGEATLVVDRDDDRVAEIAYSVTDRLHRRGLGRALLDLLIGAAHERGVHRIRADLLGENVASVALLRSAGARFGFEHGSFVADLTVIDDLHAVST